MTRSLARLLDDAARGTFPPEDGAVTVYPPVAGVRAAVFAFTAHLAVATDVDPAVVREVARPGDFSGWARVSPWLASLLGAEAWTGDVMLAAIAEDDGERALVDLDRETSIDHPRVARAVRYRDDVRVYVTRDRAGVLVLGRGVAGRNELAYEVESHARNAGLGRALAAAALAMTPAGEALWAQVHPGNAASVRSVLRAGFRPVGYEQLVP
jgi:RimJ/RimL family protein N-acetyltransferase